MASFAVGLYEGTALAESLRVKRGGLKFTNGTGQLRMPTGPSSGSVFSFCAWVKITTDTNFYALWLSLQGASTTYWEAGFDIAGTGAIVADAGFERAVGVSFTVGTWYFFGVTHASGTVKVYTGAEGGTLTEYSTTLASLTLPLSEKLFGGELSSEPLSGAMSEVRGWNATLTAAEMFAEFRSETQVRTSNALGYWKMESSASKTTDSSGNSNTLTNPQGTGTWATEPGPRVDGAPTADLYENVGMAEVIDTVYTGSGGTAYTGNVNETVTLSEALGAVMAAVIGVAETNSLSESVGVLSGVVVGISENPGLSESLGALVTALAGLAETAGVSEAISAGTAYSGGISESVGAVGESLSAQFGAITNPNEQVTILESLGALVAASVSVVESATIAEALAAVAGAQAAIAETASLSESLSVQRGTNAGVAETTILTESLNSLMTVLANISETVNLAESVSATIPFEHIIALLAQLRESAWQVATAAFAWKSSITNESKWTVTIERDNMIVIEGTRVRLQATFTDPNGDLYDPASPVLTVLDNGTETPYTPPTVVNSSVGVYYCDVLFPVSGDASYVWSSASTGEETVAAGKVRVIPAPF